MTMKMKALGTMKYVKITNIFCNKDIVVSCLTCSKCCSNLRAVLTLEPAWERGYAYACCVDD